MNFVDEFIVTHFTYTQFITIAGVLIIVSVLATVEISKKKESKWWLIPLALLILGVLLVNPYVAILFVSFFMFGTVAAMFFTK